MAAKKTMVGKALAGLKAAAKSVGMPRGSSDASSERIVQIPEIAVFSELPFAPAGKIGGTGVNVISSPARQAPGKKTTVDSRKNTVRPAKTSAQKTSGPKTSGSKASGSRASASKSSAAKASTKISGQKAAGGKASARKSPTSKTSRKSAKRKKAR